MWLGLCGGSVGCGDRREGEGLDQTYAEDDMSPTSRTSAERSVSCLSFIMNYVISHPCHPYLVMP